MIELTPKQQRFVEEYLIDLNATQAAIRSGYSEKTANEQASRLLANVNIAQAVKKAMDARSKEVGITAEYVLETIQDTIERCRQAKQVTDRKGEPIFVELPTGGVAPAFTFDSGGVLKGCELLGRHLKMFTDKIESKVQTEEIKQDLSKLSTAEIETLIALQKKLSGEQ